MVSKKDETQNNVQNSVPVQIWERIKNLDLGLFALKGQTVEKHAKPIIDMSRDQELYLLLGVNSALPQLEELTRGFNWAPGKTLEVEQRDKFCVVKVVDIVR